MSDTLKPCPFCGGKAELFVIQCRDGNLYRPHCLECACAFDTQFFTEVEAVEAWNTRAERTGTMDRDEYGYWVCSGCGETLPAWVDKYPANYCPNCGAKVVE